MKEDYTIDFFGVKLDLARGTYYDVPEIMVGIIADAVEALEILKKEIQEPQVLLYDGYKMVSFYGFNGVMHRCAGYDLSDTILWWLDKQIQADGEKIKDRILAVSTEDVEWTKERNKDYNHICYRKFTLGIHAQELINREIDRLLTILEGMKAEVEKEIEEAKKAEEIPEGIEWKVEEKDIQDEGGKTKLYTHHVTINGKKFTFYERNIFDFGRVINTVYDEIIVREGDKYVGTSFSEDDDRELSGDELQAFLFVDKHGRFAKSGIRM